MTQNRLIVILVAASLIAVLGGYAVLANGSGGVPTDNLPSGFKLLALIDESTENVNITDYLLGFYGPEEIGKVNGTIGVYQWGPLGETYNAKVTILEAESPERAEAARRNYMNQPEWTYPPIAGMQRFGKQVVNGHDVVEIRKITGKNRLQLIYIWTSGNRAVLVEGNDSRTSSLALASSTGL
ncbi:MAG TPA: hypothetical protein PLI05_02635 [Methanotrichaceae archaeon]|nr:hypothetical protein [Methanotrichaceae archaeon]HQF15948.1 hypothetical protein [Methanotrichaceae archaeon]HQI90704.1 hypothetical protein [Methanotrichaceae archaeon]HQJ28017.1 hypothetical protein [Methanotrichaceae archaeon]